MAASPTAAPFPAPVPPGVPSVPGRVGVGRSVGVLLAAAAVFYVVSPVLQGAALPAVRVRFGLSEQQVVGMKVGGGALMVLSLFAAGRAGDVRGRRRVLAWSLGVLVAGLAVEAVAFSDWSYLLGRAVVLVGVSASFAGCLASVAALNPPGRMPQVLGGWLAVMSAAFFGAANLIPRAPSMPGLRVSAALGALVALGLLVLALRRLPEAGDPPVPLDRVFLAALAMALAGAVTALQVGPVWGWSDPRTLALLALLPAAAAVTARRWRLRPFPVPPRITTMALATGVAVGFTQLAVLLALPVLTAASGLGAAPTALMVSAYGAGGAAGCLLVRERRVSPVTGCSLGLPLAVIGLALCHVLPMHGAAGMLLGTLSALLTGVGVMMAQVPQMAWFLSALPRGRLGTAAAFHPVSVLLGTAAAQSLPATSAVSLGASGRQAENLLWVAAAVVAVGALIAGLPGVVLGVVGAAAAEWLLVRVLAGAELAQRPLAQGAALVVGVVTGLAVWGRRQRGERLAASRASASALQAAVLHPVPERLGGLRLASRYQPATAGTGIGGDFLEAVQTPHGTRLLIGDVRGKGLQAVQTVTDLLGCFRSQAHETADLGELAARLDRHTARSAAARDDQELFATALLLQHRAADGYVEVVNCGHLAPLALGPAGVREVAAPALLPLGFGALGGDVPVPGRVPLPAGEALLLYTDGLTEARNASREFYPAAERLSAFGAGGPAAVLSFLERDVRDWSHHLADDIALIALTPE
ncbi:SpoIIE family protein phosphatase [Kitasatospora cineracea]|uniref:Serine phosphatase RsbU (Regulator of sigma subunit) n=1 Tax=Kitasatospora cineracea TaxID=88074 RepID=A0A8G1UL90_9ACTN|nr:SpoIIE family protein phosphatase [Kitasatospora cineracea]ROR46106.1 serine phosphatase RsbU (regulator of sigma subunit) [Kitasatospora cineracea]